MSVIPESGMNFGKYDEKDLFHIETSEIYKKLGDGIPTVEFILKYNGNNIVFLEAKKSCPNVANRYESKEKELKLLEKVYENCGHIVRFISVKEEEGIDEIRELIHGKTTVLAGPSGVGKSSLMNLLHNGL